MASMFKRGFKAVNDEKKRQEVNSLNEGLFVILVKDRQWKVQ